MPRHESSCILIGLVRKCENRMQNGQVHTSRPACGECMFPDAGGDAVTAAFVLVFGGEELHKALQATKERARLQVVSGCTAYCTRCARVTWLARHASLTQAMIRHEHDFAVNSCVTKLLAGL